MSPRVWAVAVIAVMGMAASFPLGATSSVETSHGQSRDNLFQAMVWQDVIAATIDIQPDAVNLGAPAGELPGHARVTRLTAFIELPEHFDVGEIEIETVRLILPGVGSVPARNSPRHVGDYDHDGVRDLMVTFDGRAVRQLLESQNGLVTLTVSGRMETGEAFAGSDTITVYQAAPGPYETSLPATADTYVGAEWPGTNFGVYSNLDVMSYLGWSRRSLVQFNLSSLAPGVVVLNADLHLYAHAVPSVRRTYRAGRATAPWGEATVTWMAQPAFEPRGGATARTPKDPDWMTWHVTNDVVRMVRGDEPNYGWLIRDDLEGSAAPKLARFYSREATNVALRPKLTVRYILGTILEDGEDDADDHDERPEDDSEPQDEEKE